MNDELIINQMGLLLTQVRYARRALEDLERQVATYGGLSFLQRMASTEALGAPPLLNGALKVHIVNINDLAHGGGFFEELLGGIGRFFGGFFGGLAGGAVAGFRLPQMIANVAHLADVVDRIVERTGYRMDNSDSGSSSGSFMDRLPPLTDALYGLAALFRAAASGPGDGGSGPTAAQQEALGHLQRVLQPVYAILEAVGRVVDGLIILIPLGASAIAWLIAQLDRLKLVFLELMQFLLRNVFLLSGVVLVTVYDTLSSAMRLASGLLGILRDFAGHILRALFNSLADLVRVTLSALQFVAGRLAAAVDPLLDYVVERLFWVLNNLAQTPVFRVIYHVIDVLPTMLPALVRLVRDVNLSGAEQRRLRALPRLPALTMTAPTVTPFRTTGADLAAAFAPSPELTALEGDIRTLGAGMENTVNFFVGEAQGALRRMGGLLEREAATLSTRITEHTRVVRRRADELAAALRPAVAAGEQRPPTGLDRVARAYEQWIAGGGLNAMLGLITNHFRRTPEATRRLADTVALERARATVEIAEVVVEVETAAVRRADEAASLLPEPSLVDQVVEGLRDRLERGAPPSLDAFGFA